MAIRKHVYRPKMHPSGLAFALAGLLTSIFLLLQQGPSSFGPDTKIDKGHVSGEHTTAAAATPPPPRVASPDALVPTISRINTTKPVVFLTIDDGIHADPAQLDMMKQHNLKASLFLVDRFTKDKVPFFSQFIPAGSLIENHGATHYLLPDRPYEEQKEDICKQADLEKQQYGRRPVLFRPSGGMYNDTTRKAAAACGMKALVMWTAEAKNGVMEYQNGGLKPGDIVLMHFTPHFTSDLQAFIDAQNAAGLHTELLENWLDKPI